MRPQATSIADLEPASVYAQLCLLITEARVPSVEKASGHSEGPHCPQLTPAGIAKHIGHTCTRANQLCVSAEQLQSESRRLWLRGIPAVVCAVVLPERCCTAAECSHGVVVERWTLMAQPKRHFFDSLRLLEPIFLLQAVRSHLHFSQLSAWLSATRGKLQCGRVTYRICMPGEADGLRSHRTRTPVSTLNDVHRFPPCLLGRSTVLQVKVESFPRSQTVPFAPAAIESSPGQSGGKSVARLGSKQATNGTTTVNQSPAKPVSLHVAKPTPLQSVAISSSDIAPACSSTTLDLNNRLSALQSQVSQLCTKLAGLGDELTLDNIPSTPPSAHPPSTLPLGKQGPPTALPMGVFDLTSPIRETAGSGPFQCRRRLVASEGTSGEASTSQEQPHKPLIFHAQQRIGRAPVRSSTFACRSSAPLAINSSPAPLKRNHHSFAFDPSLKSSAAIRSALYHDESGSDSESGGAASLAKSAPSTSAGNLLGNFEESALNGRLQPFGQLDGFRVELAASGAFCPRHVYLPVSTFFYHVSDDDRPSSYYGHCSLESLGRRGYRIPSKGTIQVTLFNPNGTVVKMFVVSYDLHDMPPNSTTFVRQRTHLVAAAKGQRSGSEERQKALRYLIHLRFATTSAAKAYLHTDVRMLFARHTDPPTPGYELRSQTEFPTKPRYSPRKLSSQR